MALHSKLAAPLSSLVRIPTLFPPSKRTLTTSATSLPTSSHMRNTYNSPSTARIDTVFRFVPSPHSTRTADHYRPQGPEWHWAVPVDRMQRVGKSHWNLSHIPRPFQTLCGCWPPRETHHSDLGHLRKLYRRWDSQLHVREQRWHRQHGSIRSHQAAARFVEYGAL